MLAVDALGSGEGQPVGAAASPPRAHTPVMRGELVAAVLGDRDGCYVDATFGRGGHAEALLAELSPRGRLLVIDRDADAVAVAERLAEADPRVTACRTNFGDLAAALRRARLGPLAGVLFDVGASSPQFDQAARGFSFAASGPLDMRMDQRQRTTAGAWLNSASEAEIAAVIRRYGEEHQAGRVARRIVRARPLTSTAQLADAVGAATSSGGKQALARVFQAVRIHVNDELGELERGLDAAFQALAVGGRLAVLTFHRLEHRLVRRRFREWTQGPEVSRRLMPTFDRSAPVARRIAQVAKGARATADELTANPRARSALLQAVEKVSAKPQPAPRQDPAWLGRKDPWMACETAWGLACDRGVL